MGQAMKQNYTFGCFETFFFNFLSPDVVKLFLMVLTNSNLLTMEAKIKVEA